MELNLAQEGWIGIFACSKQCLPCPRAQQTVLFLKGASKSFADARKPDCKLSYSWAGAGGPRAEVRQAPFIAWFSACWLYMGVRFG